MQNLKFLGVVNITPDSFSDGGKFLSSKTLQETWSKGEFWALDIGAQSTAPKAQAIDAKEEQRRLDEFFFSQVDFARYQSAALFFDTYRPDTFFYCQKRSRDMGFSGEIYWNDVSGKVEPEVTTRFLESSDDKCKWVISHNLPPTRDETPRHMNYTQGERDACAMILEWEKSLTERLPSSLLSRIVFDPCLGFSKTREQNHQILRALPELLSQRRLPWLIGVSRKSFLRALEPSEHALQATELLQFDLLRKVAHSTGNLPVIWRLHDAAQIQALTLADEVFG